VFGYERKTFWITDYTDDTDILGAFIRAIRGIRGSCIGLGSDHAGARFWRTSENIFDRGLRGWRG
jgi:hypothetical protein